MGIALPSYVPGGVGGGDRPPRKKKYCKSPGVCPGGGMVTGHIELCIFNM